MNLTTRRLKSGRWAIYNGRCRYLTTTYRTKAEARERIQAETQWGQGNPSLKSTNHLYRRAS